MQRSDLGVEMFLLLLSVAILLMSFVMTLSGNDRVYLPGVSAPLPPMCASQMAFGVDCPGCGLTRSLISISHGQWRTAWQFNPAGYLVYAFVVLQIPWRLFQIGRLKSNKLAYRAAWTYGLPLIVIVALFAQWIAKMALTR